MNNNLAPKIASTGSLVNDGSQQATMVGGRGGEG